MPAIDWNKFGVTGASKQDSFEELCLHLFCRKHRLSEGVSGDAVLALREGGRPELLDEAPAALRLAAKIGRASCRERV